MKHKWFWFIPAILALIFLLATTGKVLAAGNTADLAKILENGLEGLKAYFAFLLDVLKVIWE